MSYASAASKNRLPESEQPHPDPNLLEGSHGSDSDDLSHSANHDEKVNVVSREEFDEDKAAFDPEYEPETSARPSSLGPKDANPSKLGPNKSAQTEAEQTAEKAQKDAQKAKQNVQAGAQKAKETGQKAAAKVEQGAKQAGDAISRDAQKAKESAKDTAATAERKAGEAAETVKNKAASAYNTAEKKAAQGKEIAEEEYNALSEKARQSYDRLSAEAKQDWNKLSKESKKKWEEAKNSEAGQELQRPEVWGTILALSNLAVSAGTIYYVIANWNKPKWDRRIVTAVGASLCLYFGGQGYLLPQSNAVRR